MNGLSLFANVGIAEAYLHEVGVDIVVANELLPERANFYQYVYPDCNMICGNILDEEIYKTQITFKLAWQETLKKYNATLTKSTRIFNTTDVVKKYDPSSEDLTYAGINVIDPAKICNIIQY